MIALTLALIGVNVLAANADAKCKTVQTQANFSVDAYLGDWYIQQQMEISYLPQDRNFCVRAQYAKKAKRNLLGWDLNVHNRDQEIDGTIHDSTVDTKTGLCAHIVDGANGKLEVAPCFLPPLLSGPYWIVRHYTDGGRENEWALVVGGQPTIPTSDGLCKTGTGINNSGLWILTRSQKRVPALLEDAKEVALKNGIDTAVLNDIDQTNCTFAYFS